jgi:hypothetical protein
MDRAATTVQLRAGPATAFHPATISRLPPSALVRRRSRASRDLRMLSADELLSDLRHAVAHHSKSRGVEARYS